MLQALLPLETELHTCLSGFRLSTSKRTLVTDLHLICTFKVQEPFVRVREAHAPPPDSRFSAQKFLHLSV
jgi:hypothetical protein